MLAYYYQFQDLMNGVFSLGIFPVIFWGVLILLGVGYLELRFFRVLRSRQAEKNIVRYDFLENVKELYTRGDISQEEFIKMQNILLES